jgi:hypothetical protein
VKQKLPSRVLPETRAIRELIQAPLFHCRPAEAPPKRRQLITAAKLKKLRHRTRAHQLKHKQRRSMRGAIDYFLPADVIP